MCLIRRRLWIGHEGFLYLLAVFVGNLVVVSLVFGPHLRQLFRRSSSPLETSNDFACKFLRFVQGVWLSSAWFVVALLVGVFLRGHAASEEARTQSCCCCCCRKFAAGYCTVLGTKVVIATIAISFALINMWTLWTVKVKPLAQFNISNASRLSVYVCDVDDVSFYLKHTWAWTAVSDWVMLYVPVAFVLPVMWILVFWSRCKRITVMRSDDSREFSRLALILGAAVFVTQFPRAVAEIMQLEFFQDHHLFLVYRAAHLLYPAYVVLVPLCCIVCVERMRNDVRAMFVCRRCCPMVVVGDEDGAGTSIIPLE